MDHAAQTKTSLLWQHVIQQNEDATCWKFGVHFLLLCCTKTYILLIADKHIQFQIVTYSYMMWHVCVYIYIYTYVLTYNMYAVYVYTYLACAPQQNRVLPTEMKPQTPGLCGTCAFPPWRRRRCEPSKLQRQHAAVGGIMDTLWHVTGDLNVN